MSWRMGGKLFVEIWPVIEANITERAQRIAFTAQLLKLFIQNDMDPWDVEDVHPEVRAAMRRIGVHIREPERYRDDS